MEGFPLAPSGAHEVRGTVGLMQRYCERTAGGSPLTVSTQSGLAGSSRFAVVWRSQTPRRQAGEIRDSEFQTANRRVFECPRLRPLRGEVGARENAHRDEQRCDPKPPRARRPK